MGFNDDCTGQGHPLLLAPRELGGHSVLQMVDFDHLQNGLHPLLDFLFGQLPVLQAKGHIVKDRHVGEHGVVLKDHADIPLAGGDIVNDLIVNFKDAPLDGVKADDHAQQGGLAAAGGTQEGKELSRPDAQVQAVDNRVISKPFYGIFNGNRSTHAVSPFLMSMMCFKQGACDQHRRPASFKCSQPAFSRHSV